MNGQARGVHGAVVGGFLGASLLVAAVVAPHAFASFPTRAQAGDYVGGVLRVIDGWAIAAGLVAAGEVLLGPGRFSRTRYALAGLLVAVGVASYALAAKLAAMRAALGPIDALPATDPGRRHFGALHGVSMLILLIGMLAALASLLLPRAGGDPAHSRSPSG